MIETFGELKNQVGNILNKLKGLEPNQFHEMVKCQVKGSDEMFEAGVSWSDLINIPDDTSMSKIVAQSGPYVGQSFLPLKASAIEGDVVLIVKPLDQ